VVLGKLVEVLRADALDSVVGRFQVLIRQEDDLHALPLLDVEDAAPFLVEQEGGDVDGQLREDALGVLLHRLFLDDAQDGQREGFDPADGALAAAAGTYELAGLAQRGAQALARHLQKPEAGNAPHLHARTVLLERLAQAVLDFALVSRRRHVDEVDDEQAPEVAQAKLAGDLVGGLEIGV
jgi:hypothetical protein